VRCWLQSATILRYGEFHLHGNILLFRPLGNTILYVSKLLHPQLVLVKCSLVNLGCIFRKARSTDETEREVLELEGDRKLETVFAQRDCIEKFVLTYATKGADLEVLRSLYVFKCSSDDNIRGH
jgi:hypothetical protein